MTVGKKYININPYSTYGIFIDKIVYFDNSRIKIKYNFINKRTGNFIDYTVYKATILRENLKDWELWGNNGF